MPHGFKTPDPFSGRSTSIRVIDSHTAGEPTRVVVEGAPDLGGGDMAARRAVMREQADWLRTSLVTEPRGSECMVGAVLQQPLSTEATAGVIFFNNVGYLGMCGHGLIGVVTTLAHLGKIKAGAHIIETPVGNVTAHLHEDGAIAFENVRSYRHTKGVRCRVAGNSPWRVSGVGVEEVVGDVAWGGNWFFFVNTQRRLSLSDIPELTRFALDIQRSLQVQGITGRDGAEIDHIELVGPPSDPATADARNFVLCPGGQYDRSPCGTGTSAKLACLAADGKLLPGQVWRQESIVGGIFEGRYRETEGGIVPTITGRAFVNADVRLVFDPNDQYQFGLVRDQV